MSEASATDPIRLPWWLWPSAMVGLAASALATSWVLVPGADEFVYFLGETRFGGECGFTVVTGLPCPQCGMTRSFVHAARGNLLQSFLYSPGGMTLFLWIQAGGVVGLARLVRRDATAMTPPWQLLFGWCMSWIVLFYSVPWALRLVGINPLP